MIELRGIRLNAYIDPNLLNMIELSGIRLNDYIDPNLLCSSLAV